MGTRRNPEAEKKDVEAKAKKIVKMVALRNFTDSEGNDHRAGEPCDVTQDEMERALVPHKLVTTPEAWAAKKQAEEKAIEATAALAKFECEDDAAIDKAADDAKAEQDDVDAGTTSAGTTGEGRRTRTSTK